MGLFSTTREFYGDASKIPYVAQEIGRAFMAEGYEVKIDNPLEGNRMYITKGGLFKAALGLRSALEITMKSTGNGRVRFKAGVNVIKQQFVPTVITVCFLSPVVVAQIWGMIKQSKLDEKAAAIAERAFYQSRA